MNRKSPTESATSFAIGTIKKGNDGNKWKITKTSNGVKRWTKITEDKIIKKESTKTKLSNSFIPVDKLSNKEYLIHDNGGRPFKVITNKDGIQVFAIDEDDPFKINEVYSITPSKFLGYWFGYDSGHPIHKMHGNSVLIQLTKHHYVNIGWKIIEFSTDDVIIDYISPVGNSDVPYPVAYGEDNVYFILEMKYIKKDELETSATVANAVKIYGEFYGHIGDKKKKKEQHNVKKVKVLVKRVSCF